MEDGVLLAERFQNNGKTHSATLMPMAEELLRDCGLTAGDLDVVAVAKGPGSFTGVRIGVAAAKGLAWAAEKPMVGVSTLEAMAWQLRHLSGVILPVMDARRAQVYNAVFRSEDGQLIREAPDRAISLADLGAELEKEDLPIFLVGDGSGLCYNTLRGQIPGLVLPPPHLHQQRACGVAMAATQYALRGQFQSPTTLVPNYLRLSQAERERLARLGTTGENLKGDT